MGWGENEHQNCEECTLTSKHNLKINHKVQGHKSELLFSENNWKNCCCFCRKFHRFFSVKVWVGIKINSQNYVKLFRMCHWSQQPKTNLKEILEVFTMSWGEHEWKSYVKLKSSNIQIQQNKKYSTCYRKTLWTNIALTEFCELHPQTITNFAIKNLSKF